MVVLAVGKAGAVQRWWLIELEALPRAKSSDETEHMNRAELNSTVFLSWV